MTCDPNTIAQNAKCFCYDRTTWRAVMVYLMCQWVKKKEPTELIVWSPDTAVASWTDGGGLHNGNLSSFRSTADMDSVTVLTLNGTGITLLENLDVLPALLTLNCNNNALTSLSVAGCNALTFVDATNNQITAFDGSVAPNLTQISIGNNNLALLDVTGLVALTFLDCNTNGALTTITGIATCTALNNLYFGTGIVGDLDIHNANAMSTIVGTNNLNLTGFWISALSNAWFDVELDGCALRAGSLADPYGVNNILAAVAGPSLGNAGSCILNGGTNAAPTVGPPDGTAAKAALIAALWGVNTN